MVFVKIDEMIEKLLKIKKEHGDLDIIGSDDYDIEFVEPQKFIKTSSEHNNIITRQTEDLEDVYLEEMYIDDDKYNKYFVSKGVCVKVY